MVAVAIMNTFPHSILDLATVVEGDSIQQTFEKSVQTAQFAEQLGYSRYWFSEHHNFESVASAATSILIGHVAGKTKQIRVGAGGIMLPNHSPLVIAEQFGTLGEIYPNRIDLGLGRAPGTDIPTAIAIRGTHPGSPYNFEQHILELQRYFSPENASAMVRAIPGEGVEVPIWVLGSSTSSAKLAAKLGLPYAFAAHFAPQQLIPAMEIYHAEFQASTQLQQPYAMACVTAIIAEDQAEAEYLSTSMLQAFSRIITDDRKPLQQPINRDELIQSFSPKVIVALQKMLSMAIIGNQELFQKQMKQLVAQTGIQEVMLSSQIYDVEKKHRSLQLVSEVLQNF